MTDISEAEYQSRFDDDDLTLAPYTEFKHPDTRRPRKQRVWTTKSGETTLISKMTNSHLINTIRLLQRGARRIQDAMCLQMAAFVSTLHGEMAQDCADKELEEMGEMDSIEFLSQHHEPYQWLIAEAVKRKLYTEEIYFNNLEQWLRYRDPIWSSSKRLSAFLEQNEDDYWTDKDGVWSVEVLDDGTAVTVCYEP